MTNEYGNGIGKDRLGPQGDDFYEMLMTAHEGLGLQESARFNARLVLILANQVADIEELKKALAAARTSNS